MMTPRKTFISDRDDNRFIGTAGFMHAVIKSRKPTLAFDPGMDARDFHTWQDRLRQKVLELMAFPELSPQPPPKLITSEQREDYRLQRWEAYPEPFCVVPFLMLVPDGTSSQSPTPAVMCFPGFAGSKESMAGEPELNGRQLDWNEEKRHDNCIALHCVRNGMIAVAIDNPACAELADDMRTLPEVSRCMFWMGRNYLGVSVFQKNHILKWLAELDIVDSRRIAACGLSLGADPADIVGLLNPHRVAAVVHNDFVCHWRERTVAMNGNPNTAWHVLPGMYNWCDAPDIQAALAPRPLLFTEGGRTVHINAVRAAYAMQESPDNLTVHYYKKYASAESRQYDGAPIPEGLSPEEYFLYANIDVGNHRYHPEHIIPWLTDVLGI